MQASLGIIVLAGEAQVVVERIAGVIGVAVCCVVAKRVVIVPAPDITVGLVRDQPWGVEMIGMHIISLRDTVAHYDFQWCGNHGDITVIGSMSRDVNYLMDELPARLAKEPAQFEIAAQLAEKRDNINDPTAVWPESRKQVVLVTLTLTSIDPEGASYAKTTMFNPLTLVDGIAPSDDPILLARPGAYAVSFGRRLK